VDRARGRHFDDPNWSHKKHIVHLDDRGPCTKSVAPSENGQHRSLGLSCGADAAHGAPTCCRRYHRAAECPDV